MDPAEPAAQPPEPEPPQAAETLVPSVLPTADPADLGPPEAGEAPAVNPAPWYALFAPVQVGLATLLGGPLAGSVLLAHNSLCCGRIRAAAATLFVGLAGTAAILLGGDHLPVPAGWLGYLVTTLVLGLAMAGFTQATQGAFYA